MFKHINKFCNFLLALQPEKDKCGFLNMNNPLPSHSNQKQVSEHVIQTLLYFDIFNCPLSAKEVFRFLGTNHVDINYIQQELNNLTKQGVIFHFGEFFSLKNDVALIGRRTTGNSEAKKFLSIAKKKAKLIASFPFVRAVMGSGSLSKGYMDENSDLDFFIVTEPGRLWIARILLVMYKRIFLLNSHKYFCVNYFVDTEHLEIEEKNLFTATELATVIPLYGAEHYQNLFRANSWLSGFFPNHIPRSIADVPSSKRNILKKLMETCINVMFAKQLNNFFMKITLNRWKKLYRKDYPNADFQVAFKTKDYAYKSHPKHYQRKVMDLYEEKLREFSFHEL